MRLNSKANRRTVRGNGREDPSPRQPNLTVTPMVTEVETSRKGRAVSGTVDTESTARRLLNVKEAAEYLGGISVWTVRSLGWSGEICQVRIGRRVLYDRQDLDRFIESVKT